LNHCKPAAGTEVRRRIKFFQGRPAFWV